MRLCDVVKRMPTWMKRSALGTTMMLATALPSFGQGVLQGTVETDKGVPVENARLILEHENGTDADTAYTDALGQYMTDDVYVGIEENIMQGLEKTIMTVPNPARDHNIYVKAREGVESVDIYDLQGKRVAELPVEVNAKNVGHAYWEGNVPNGVYIASYADEASKIVHLNNGAGSERKQATPQAVTEQFDKQKPENTKDNYNVTLESESGKSNVLFPTKNVQEDIIDGVNTRDFTVMPSSYLHHYLIQADHPANVTVEVAGKTVYDGNVSGNAKTDSVYGGESEQVSVVASAPGKVTLDTLMAKEWNGDTIPLNLKDSTYTFILQGASPDSTQYELWDKDETTQLSQGIAHNGYADTIKTSQTLDSMLVKMQKQGRVDKDTIIGVAQGANTFDMPELDLEYQMSVNGSANGATLKVVYNTDTLVSGTLDTTQTPDWQATIVRSPTENMDSVEMVQEKQGRALTKSKHEVKEGQNAIQLPEMNYENDLIYGQILRKKSSGSNNVINKAFVKIKGLNVNYETTEIMNGQSYYEFTKIPIPADPQGNADTAMYERTILPTDTSSTQMFKEYVDTIKITKNTFDIGNVTVQQLDQDQSIKGTITDIYDSTKTLDSVKVIFRSKADSSILRQDVTGANGKYELHNIPCDTQGFFQVGYKTTNAGYLSREGHEYKAQAEIIQPKDSSATVNWTLVPDSLIIPATPNDPNHGNKVKAVPSKIKDMIRGPHTGSAGYIMDAEEASGRQVQLNYGSMSQSRQQTFETFVIQPGDSLFYGISKDVPINDPSRPFELITYNVDANHYNNNYHPTDNYHADSLGWNVSHGGNTTYPSGNTSFDNEKQYPEYSTNGGSIYVDLGDQAGNIKEIYGRSEKRMDVTGYPSFMNLNASMPTLQDRAIIYLLHENEKKRLGENSVDYYPLDKLTNNISTY